MDQQEICIAYKTAADKRKMVPILADLTRSDTETIVEILDDAGLYEDARCSRCGQMYHRIYRPYCIKCEDLILEQKRQQKAHHDWIMYQVKQNAQRILKLKAQIAAIRQQDKKLMEELE